MGSGKKLTEYEKGQIDARRANGDGYLKIGTALGRSTTAIANYVKGKTGQTKSTGRPKVLTMQQEVQIVNKASNSTKSLSKIKRELKLNVSKMTIWRVLKRSKFIVRRKMRKSPNLTDNHKVRRLEFAKENMATDWKKVNIVCWVLNFWNFRWSSATRKSSTWTVRTAAIHTGMICERRSWESRVATLVEVPWW